MVDIDEILAAAIRTACYRSMVRSLGRLIISKSQVRSRGSRTRGIIITSPARRAPRPTLRIAKRRAPRASGEVSARQDGAGACTACHRGQLGDDRRPSSLNRAAVSSSRRNRAVGSRGGRTSPPCRSHKNQCCHSRAVCAAARRDHSGPFGTKLVRILLIYPDVDSSNTRLPLVRFQIADQGLFICISHPPRVQDLTNMHPKRPGRLVLHNGSIIYIPSGGSGGTPGG